MWSTNKHQLDYQNFQVSRRVFPKNGSAKGWGKTILKNNLSGSKGGVFMQNRKLFSKEYTILQ